MKKYIDVFVQIANNFNWKAKYCPYTHTVKLFVRAPFGAAASFRLDEGDSSSDLALRLYECCNGFDADRTAIKLYEQSKSNLMQHLKDTQWIENELITLNEYVQENFKGKY